MRCLLNLGINVNIILCVRVNFLFLRAHVNFYVKNFLKCVGTSCVTVVCYLCVYVIYLNFPTHSFYLLNHLIFLNFLFSLMNRAETLPN